MCTLVQASVIKYAPGHWQLDHSYGVQLQCTLVELAIDNHHSFKELVVVVYSWQVQL